jgi:hypothetical protein
MPKDTVKFLATKGETIKIYAIAHRAVEVAKKYGIEGITVTDTAMDLDATISNGNPLRLDDLLKADDFNFSHDVFGIRWHLNRNNGKLENHFLPRFSQRESVDA